MGKNSKKLQNFALFFKSYDLSKNYIVSEFQWTKKNTFLATFYIHDSLKLESSDHCFSLNFSYNFVCQLMEKNL